MRTSGHASDHTGHTSGHRHRAWFLAIGIGAVLVMVSAVGGAVGLIGGGLSMGDTVESRLPFGSPVLGGVALALLVAGPFSVLALRAFRRDRGTALASVVAGMVLIGWLIVELAFIRTFSFFHPLFTVIGLAFVAAGWACAQAPAQSMATCDDGADRASIERFLKCRRLAVMGASTDPKKFGSVIFRELRARDYDVVPVHPRAATIDDLPCVPSIDAAGRVDGAVVMLTGPAALDAVRACVSAKVPRVWLFRGAGSPGAMSAEAVRLCRDADIDVVAGACPLMFLEPTAAVHRWHLALRRLDGSLVDTREAVPV